MELTISEVARQIGVQPSAIRYYEQLGILPAAKRSGGQRRYGPATVQRLAVLRVAQDAGFTLNEIRELFLGFPQPTPLSKRWKLLAGKKRAELDEQMRQIQCMRNLLGKLETQCDCGTVAQCGEAILTSKALGDSLQSASYGRTGNPPRRKRI